MDQSIQYEQRVIAFLDILGWRDLVRSSVEDATLRSKLGMSLHVLKSLGNRNREAWSSRQFTQFSDTILISYRYGIHDVWHLLWDVAVLCQSLLPHGLLMRGGITSGPLYHQAAVAFGPGLTEAYDLEKSSAHYPRVILGENLVGIALQCEVFMTSDSLGAPLGRDKLVRADTDGCHFVDFLQPSNATTAGDLPIGPVGEHLNLVRPTIIEGLTKYAKRPTVFEKYEWLAHYFNALLLDYPDTNIQPIEMIGAKN